MERIHPHEEIQEKDRLYVSDVVMMDTIEKGKLNLIVAPCASGKTYFVEHMLKDYNENPRQDMLYLTPTVSLRNAFNYRGDQEIIDLGNGQYLAEWKQEGVTAMTYASFGKRIYEAKMAGTYRDDLFWNDHSLICPDELSQAAKQITYHKGGDVNYTKVAFDELEKRVDNPTNTVVTINATPRLGIRRFDIFKIHIVKLSEELEELPTKNTETYHEIEVPLSRVGASEKGLIYTRLIKSMKKIKGLLESKGIDAALLFSPHSKSHKMTLEAQRAARMLEKEERIPDDVQVLIINAAYETGLNIDPEKSHLDYIIVHDADEDTQTQVRGRYRGELDRLYLKMREEDFEREIPYEIIEPYLGRVLWSADRRELVQALNFRDKNGRQCMWPTVKNVLINQGYSIEEWKRHGKNVAQIEHPEFE